MAKRKKEEEQSDKLPLVALELGSNSIRAMAAERIGEDTLRILGYEESNKFDCIDRGIVTQTTDAGFMISEVLRKLGNRIQYDNLPTAFLLVGGRTMQSVPVACKRDLIHKRVIPTSLLIEMEKECCEKIELHNPEAAVLAIIPSYFVLDGVEQEEKPRPDQRTVQLEAHYIAFVGKKELKTKIQDSFDRAGKSIEKAFIRPEALLSAFAPDNPDALYDGCAVLDMGAETTTLTVFKGTEYLLTKVIAQGSDHVTRLITHQGISRPNAEKLKTQYGFASPELVEKDLRMRIASTGGDSIRLTSKDLATLIRQKLDEIVDPLMVALKQFEERISVVYITGGGSLMEGMEAYIQSKTGVKVLYGSHAQLLASDTPEEYYSPEYASLVGGLILGSDYRNAHPGQKIPPAKIGKKIGDLVLDIFTYNDTTEEFE